MCKGQQSHLSETTKLCEIETETIDLWRKDWPERRRQGGQRFSGWPSVAGARRSQSARLQRQTHSSGFVNIAWDGSALLPRSAAASAAEEDFLSTSEFVFSIWFQLHEQKSNWNVQYPLHQGANYKFPPASTVSAHASSSTSIRSDFRTNNINVRWWCFFCLFRLFPCLSSCLLSNTHNSEPANASHPYSPEVYQYAILHRRLNAIQQLL